MKKNDPHEQIFSKMFLQFQNVMQQKRSISNIWNYSYKIMLVSFFVWCQMWNKIYQIVTYNPYFVQL